MVKLKQPKRPTADERRTVKEWAKRALAMQSLHAFVRQAWHIVEPYQAFVDNWHIQAICEHLEAVSSGEIENLLINVPPGTSKSTLVCVMWPTWEWTNNPGLRQLFASYSESYALRDSVKSRRVVESQWYRENWGDKAEEKWGGLLPDGFEPLRISADQNQKSKFENTKGGWRVASSVGGATGEHPDRIGIDDPHKINEAESDKERQAVLDWSDGVLSMRGAMRNVRRVGVMQRLHGQDWSGHVMQQGNWVHICLPMRYEAPTVIRVNGLAKEERRMEVTPIGWCDPRKTDGELLWPDVYPESKVANLEAKLGLYHAAGQLQQRPSPRGGGTFQRQWFEVVNEMPELRRIIRYWDKAGTKGGSGAQSAGVLMGEYIDHAVVLAAMRMKYIILDVITVRLAAAEREKVILETAKIDGANYGYVETWVEQEPGSGGKESAENTVANLSGFTCFIERVTGSKEVRAEPMASQASVGKIKVMAGPWNSQLLDELEQFPMGRLKDMVDASSGAFNKFNMLTGAFSTATGTYTGQNEFGDSERLETERLGKDDM